VRGFFPQPPLTHHRARQHRAAPLPQPKSDSSDFGQSLKAPELGQARVRVGEGTIMRTALVVLFTCQTAYLVPAAQFLRPGFCILASPSPDRGVAERRETFGCSGTRWACAHASKTRVNTLMTPHARRLARRLASHDAGRSPLGAPPWRFWAPGPRFSHRHPPPLTLRRTLSKPAIALRRRAFAPDRSQRAPRTQVIVPGRRGPELQGASGYEPPPQDATPRSAFRIVSGDAPR
jgi:hypothetical protein